MGKSKNENEMVTLKSFLTTGGTTMKEKNLRTCINWLTREQLKELLEGNGLAVFDSESTEDLGEALFECVEAGDIDEQTVRDLVE